MSRPTMSEPISRHGASRTVYSQDPALVRSDDPARDVRDHQPDEADGPGRGGRRTAQQRDGDDHQHPGAPQACAHGRGLVVAQRRAFSDRESSSEITSPGRRRMPDASPAPGRGRGQRAGTPEAHGVERGFIEQGESLGDAGQHGAKARCRPG